MISRFNKYSPLFSCKFAPGISKYEGTVFREMDFCVWAQTADSTAVLPGEVRDPAHQLSEGVEVRLRFPALKTITDAGRLIGIDRSMRKKETVFVRSFLI